MKKVDSDLFISLEISLLDVFFGNYSVSLSDFSTHIVVHSCDGFYSQSLCEELLDWCRKHGCRFCFCTPDSVMEIHVIPE